MQEKQPQDYGILIAKKAERLVSALYLVTDLLDNNEPIKLTLRKSAVELLTSMNSLSQPEVKDRIVEYKKSLKSVTEILSFIFVAKTSGCISEMNSNLLIEGFRSLQLVLEKKQPILTKEMLLIDRENELNSSEISFPQAVSSTSYDVITPLTLKRVEDDKKIDENKIEVSEHKRQHFHNTEQTVYYKKDLGVRSDEDVRRQQAKDVKFPESVTVKDKNTSHESRQFLNKEIHKTPVTFSSSFQMKKGSRREQILALFAKGVDLGIKDISARVKGCSEKTIQRELNNLVFDKVVTRIGEKRWSRYMLR